MNAFKNRLILVVFTLVLYQQAIAQTPIARLPQAKNSVKVSLQSKHTGSINKIQMSHDGRWILTASNDTSAVLWDANSGRRLHMLPHAERVIDAKFSPDSNSVLTIDFTGNVAIWDSKTGKLVKNLPTGFDRGFTVDFSKNGKYLAAGGDVPRPFGTSRYSPYNKAKAIVWDFSSFEIVAIRNSQRNSVKSLRFHPTNDSLLIGYNQNSDDKTYLLAWGFKDKKVLWKAKYKYNWSWSSIVFPPQGDVMAVLSDRVITSVSGAGYEIKELKRKTTGKIIDLFADSTGSRVFCVTPDAIEIRQHTDNKKVYLFERGGRARFFAPRLGSWLAGEHSITSACLSADEKRLAIAYSDESIEIREIASGKVKTIAKVTTAPVATVDLHPQNTHLIVSHQHHATEWDLQTGRLANRYSTTLSQQHQQSGNSITDVNYSNDGKLVMVTGYYGGSRLWEHQAEEPGKFLKYQKDGSRAAKFVANNARVVTCDNNLLTIWDLDTQEKHWEFDSRKHRGTGYWSKINDVAVSPKGKFAIATSNGSGGGDITIGALIRLDLEPAGAGVVATNKTGFNVLEFSPSSEFFCTGSFDKKLTVRNSLTCAVRRTYPCSSKLTAAGISPAGDIIVAGEQRGVIAVWRRSTNSQVARLNRHQKSVSKIKFSSDGHRMISCSEDGKTILWDTATWQELATMVVSNDGKDWLVYTPDGRFDGTDGGKNLLSIQNADSGEYLSQDAIQENYFYSGLLAIVWTGSK